MSKDQMARAFNEWMRRFTEAPEQFEGEWASVKAFLKEAADGKEPSYGEACAEYLLHLAKQEPAQ